MKAGLVEMETPRSSINNYTDGAIFIRMYYASMIYYSYREFSRNIEFFNRFELSIASTIEIVIISVHKS